MIASVTTTITIAAGVLMTVIDHKGFPSIGSGLWWAVQTVTTVGYGDHVPETRSGQIVAAVVMLLGIGFVTVITASITGAFVARTRKLPDCRGRPRGHRRAAAANHRAPGADRIEPEPVVRALTATSAHISATASRSESFCSLTSDFQVEKATAWPSAARVRRRAAPRRSRPAMRVSRAVAEVARGTRRIARCDQRHGRSSRKRLSSIGSVRPVEGVELAQRDAQALVGSGRWPPTRPGRAAGSRPPSERCRRRTAPPRRGSGGRRSSGARRRARRRR